MGSKTTVTLVHKNCGRNCRICAYGAMEPVDYATVRKVTETLMRQGYRVHLYDFYIRKESIGIYRLTRQFEANNPGWLNVTCDIELPPEDLAYVNNLRTAIAISLHGSTEEVHRRSSGKNDFAEIMGFVGTYGERFRLPLGINYVVSRENVDDVEAMIELARSLPLDFLELIPLGYSGNAVGALGPQAILTPADKLRVHGIVSRLREATPYRLELDAIWGPDFVNDPAPQCRFFAAAVPHNYCNAGVNHWAIRLNDMRVFPCPCMAGVDSLSVGTFDGQKLDVDHDWMGARDRIEEPCKSCDKFSVCQGGCRLAAMSDFRITHGRDHRYAGFHHCFHHLAKSQA